MQERSAGGRDTRPAAEAEEVSPGDVSPGVNLSGKRTVSGQDSEKPNRHRRSKNPSRGSRPWVRLESLRFMNRGVRHFICRTPLFIAIKAEGGKA